MSISTGKQRLPQSPRRVKNDPSSRTSTLTSKSSPDSLSSCSQFRTGYRIQRRAYERRAQTPTLSSIIRNRHAGNEYVDLLKNFYRQDTEDEADDYPKRIGFDRNNSSSSRVPPAGLKSNLRLPDMKPRPMLNKDVKTPSSPSSGSHFGRNHVTNIPPPIPFQLLNTNAQSGHRRITSASSLSSDLTASILEAVNDSGKSTSKGKTSKVQQNRRRQRPHKVDNDPRRVAMKVSMPCRIGCCYCVYRSLLGPVKVFLTRGQKPKQGPWLAGIRDGNGRLSIPVSRKKDVSGLVYNAHSYSLHPPAKGQRPLFPLYKNHNAEKTKVKEKTAASITKRNKTPVT